MVKDFVADGTHRVFTEADWQARLDTFSQQHFQMAYVYAPELRPPNKGLGVDFGGAATAKDFADLDFMLLVENVRATDPAFDAEWQRLWSLLTTVWRVLSEDGSLYLQLDHAAAHYVKVLLDDAFGRDNFLNEIIWVHDFGRPTTGAWPARHQTILVYVKDPANYHFSTSQVDREPYMAPNLVSAEKAERGKLPTDVWWHTLLSEEGSSRSQPEPLLRRIMAASSQPGKWVLGVNAPEEQFVGAAESLERHYVLVTKGAYNLR